MNKNKEDIIKKIGILKYYFPEWTSKKALKLDETTNLLITLFILEIFNDLKY